MNTKNGCRLAGFAALAALGMTCLVQAAEDKVFTKLAPAPVPKIIASAEAFNGSYLAENVLKPAGTSAAMPEYASRGAGEKTFIDFDFGQSLRLAGFRHIQRRTIDTIAEAKLVLSDRSDFATTLAAVPVRHVDESGGTTFASFPPVAARYVRWQVTSVLPGRSRNVGGRGIEFFVAGETGSGLGGIALAVKPVPVVERAPGGLVQALEVRVDYPFAEPVTGTLRVEGLPPQDLAFSFGSRTVELKVPAIDAPRTLHVAVDVGGREVAVADAAVQPWRKRTVYVLPHSHTDIGYTALQTDIEEKQVNNLLQGMADAKRTASYPAGARFVWNVEVLWGADLFLRRLPEAQRAELFEAVKRGQVSLNGMYLNELTGLCRPEELLRLFRYATKLGEQCGVKVDSAMISDVPGYTWGTVTAMAHAGIRYFSVAPNYFDRIGDILVQWENKPFWWVGPDGKSKVLVWIPFWGYAMSHRYREFTPQLVRDFCDGLEKRGYPYDIAYVRWAGHGDNAVPDPAICDAVKAWNDSHESPRFVISSTSEAFRAFENRHGAEIPQVRGDWTPYWEDGAGSSAAETAMNRASSERLSQAEALWAMLQPRAYPAARFEDAWNDVLLYSEHTWGAFCSISDPANPFTSDQWNLKRTYAESANQRSRQLLAEAAQRGAGFTPAGPEDLQGGACKVSRVDVYNTSSWARTGLVLIPRELSEAGDVVTDAQGRTVPSQRLASRELAVLVRDLPPFAGRRYCVRKEGERPAGTGVKVAAELLENEWLSLRIDPASGGIVELRAKGIEGNLADSDGGQAINDFLYFTGSDVGKVQRSGPAKITVRDRGALVGALRIESDAPGCHRLIREVRLVAGGDAVELIDTVDKKRIEGTEYHAEETKESLNFAFPLRVPDGELKVEIPFAVFRPEREQIPGACKNWVTVGRWADVSNRDYGITWLSLDAPLVQLGGLTANLLNSQTDPQAWRKTIEPTQKLYSWAMNNHWGTNYRAYQEGPVTFRYVLRPHRGTTAAAASRFATEFSQPLVAVPGRGPAPQESSLVKVEPAGVIATALKPSDDGKGLILRLFGASEETAFAKLTWAQPGPRRVWFSDTGEHPGQEVTGEIPVPAWGLVTLRAEWGK